MPMDRLVGHIAEMPGWSGPTVEKDSLDRAPAGAPALQAAIAKSRQEALAMFDKNVVEGRAAIARANDENMMKTWTLLAGGKTMFSIPRIVVLRSMIMDHIIHHRSQLGVYLRLKHVPVPSTHV